VVRRETRRLCEAGLDFEPGTVAARQRADGGDAPAGHEDRAHEAGLCGRHKQAAPHPPQPVDSIEVTDELLEGCDAVSKPGRILEAAALGKVAQPPAKTWEREGGLHQLGLGRSVEGAARKPRTGAAA
jgi:hypothetical protein